MTVKHIYHQYLPKDNQSLNELNEATYKVYMLSCIIIIIIWLQPFLKKNNISCPCIYVELAAYKWDNIHSADPYCKINYWLNIISFIL